MANPTVTYTFVNGNVADASQVNQNFTDIINSLTDGTKSLNIDAITAAGTATFNGNTTIGNAAGDTHTVTGRISGNGCIPAGSITAYAGSSIPTGWLLCDGSAVSRTTYSDLFTAIGTTWNTCTNPLTGVANSAPSGTEFRLPDLRGTFLRGVGDFTDNTKDTTLAGFQSSKNLGHTHIIVDALSGKTLYFTTSGNPGSSGALLVKSSSIITYDGSSSFGTYAEPSASSDGSTEARPQNVGVYFIIKT